MGPDVGVKLAQFYSKSCPKRSHSSLTYKVTVFKLGVEIDKYLGYFSTIICLQDFSKMSNQVTLELSLKGPFRRTVKTQ